MLILRPVLPRLGRLSTGGIWRCYGEGDLEGYRTLKEATEVTELIIKKSRFLARAWPIEDATQAADLVKEHRDNKASHNCYAYKIGYECKYVDDGEPNGTGGKPIFGAIESLDLDRICVLVTRHFGGVKLGAGPLGRAYGEAARQCLQSIELIIVRPTVTNRHHIDGNCLEGGCRSPIARLNGKILSKIPTHSGLCVVTFRIEEQYFDDFKSSIEHITSKNVEPRIKRRTPVY